MPRIKLLGVLRNHLKSKINEAGGFRPWLGRLLLWGRPGSATSTLAISAYRKLIVWGVTALFNFLALKGLNLVDFLGPEAEVIIVDAILGYLLYRLPNTTTVPK